MSVCLCQSVVLCQGAFKKEPPMACLHDDAEESWGELPDSKLLSWDIITVFCLNGHQVGKKTAEDANTLT